LNSVKGKGNKGNHKAKGPPSQEEVLYGNTQITFTPKSKSEQEEKKVELIQTVLRNSGRIHQKGSRPLVEFTRVKMEHPPITTIFKPSSNIAAAEKREYSKNIKVDLKQT